MLSPPTFLARTGVFPRCARVLCPSTRVLRTSTRVFRSAWVFWGAWIFSRAGISSGAWISGSARIPSCGARVAGLRKERTAPLRKRHQGDHHCGPEKKPEVLPRRGPESCEDAVASHPRRAYPVLVVAIECPCEREDRQAQKVRPVRRQAAQPPESRCPETRGQRGGSSCRGHKTRKD